MAQMNRAARAASLLLVMLLAPAARAAEPAASDNDAARTHYARGVQLYNEGSFQAALSELQQAYHLSPTYRLLYNIALIELRLGDFVGARKTFRDYLDQGGAEVQAPRREEVQRYVSEATLHIGVLDVGSNVEGAQLTLDDQPAGTTPLASVQVNPGRHRIAATKEGYNPAARWVDVAGGDHQSVTLHLEEVAKAPVAEAPAAPAPVPPPSAASETAAPPPPSPAARPPLWIGWTATGVFAAGAIVTGVAALSESSKLGDEVSNHATSGATIRSTHDTTQKLAITSDVLSGLTLIAAGTTLYFTLRTRHTETAEAPHAELRIGPGSLGVHGTF